MFVKFASLEVLEVKSAAKRQRSASLSKFANYNDYRTDDGYVYVRVRAISSRVNKNHDGWPSAELQKAYRSFIGKPIFVDHHNSDPKKARGVIVDAAIHVEDSHTASLDPYYSGAPAEHLPPTWIELLLEVDAKKFPRLAKAVVAGDIDGVSMGCNVELSKCSHCGNEARTPEEYCKHVQSKGAYFDVIDNFGNKTSKKAYEDCYDIGFFEISFVFDPADETALVSDIKHSKAQRVAAIHAEGGETKIAFDYGNLGPNEIGAALHAAGYAVDQTGHILSQAGHAVGHLVNGIAQWGKSSQCPNFAGDPSKVDPIGCPVQGQHPMPGVFGKTADRNPPPQSEMTTAPDKVDTLRQEQVCPICGSDMEDGVCEVCNYEEPPEGFDNPDLSKAKEVDEQMRKQDEQQAAQGQSAEVPNDVQPAAGNGPTPMPGGAQPGAQPVTSKAKWSAPVKVENQKTSAATGGRINTQERPILPVTRQLSDKPIAQKTISQASKPVESNVKDNMTQTQKTADGASPQGEGVQAEKRVDVEGVGAVSGDPLSGIDHENVEKDTGDFVAPHTDTWSDGQGDSLGQQDAVTSDTGDLITVSGTEKTAEGIDTWDSPGNGFPDHDPARVDLEAGLKEEVGERTQTDSSEQFRSLKNTEPVTKGDDANANNLGGPVGVAVAKAKAIQLKAFKVAEVEIDLGLAEAEQKFDRVAELESQSEEALDAQIATLARVKTAGLKRSTPTPKTAATRMPSMKPVTAAFEINAHGVDANAFEDSIF